MSTIKNSDVTILVVEDSNFQAVKLRHLLEKNGFKVSLAQNGIEALDYLAENRPTLIISDIVMPEMDGYELCQAIRDDDSMRDIPIILLTALSDLEDVVKALKHGADNFVTKPYNPDFLLDRIHNILVNADLRRRKANQDGFEIYFADKRFVLDSNPRQMVDLLFSTFANAVYKNHELLDTNRQLVSAQQELRTKNEELKDLNDKKDRFLGMAAHDMRNPLGHISTIADLLSMMLDDQLDEEQRELIGIVKSTSEFMLRLINELLDIAEIESGKLTLNLELVNLTNLVRRNIMLNAALAEKKEIDVRLSADSDPIETVVDPGKIEQVLNNLLSNAVKYSYPETTVTVRIKKDGPFALISVKDQGQGIPADEIKEMFVPFKKTSVRSTAGERSTGLGLAIVHRIVTGHGGEIWVESEVGKGSTFFMLLPVNTDVDAVTRATAEA